MFQPARATQGSFPASMHAQEAQSPPIDYTYRAVWVLIFLAGLSVLLLAAWLNPNPIGTSTHTQLGLPPCGLLERTGIPCPSCGMTTAFAWAAHGRLDQSFIVQPAGALLALLTACAVILSAYLAITGKDITRLLDDRIIIRCLIAFGVIVIVAWAYKIYAVTHHIG